MPYRRIGGKNFDSTQYLTDNQQHVVVVVGTVLIVLFIVLVVWPVYKQERVKRRSKEMEEE